MRYGVRTNPIYYDFDFGFDFDGEANGTDSDWIATVFGT